MSSKLLTVHEVADLLQISHASVRRLAHQGKIPCIILGPRTIRFDLEALDLWRKQFFQPAVDDPIADHEKAAARQGLVGPLNPQKEDGRSLASGMTWGILPLRRQWLQDG